MLDHRGGFKCDTTVTKIGDDEYYVVSAAAAESHDLDWMQKLMPQDGSVTIDISYCQGPGRGTFWPS